MVEESLILHDPYSHVQMFCYNVSTDHDCMSAIKINNAYVPQW